MKINGVELDDLNKLRDDIKENFGSIYAFSRQTGYSYSILKRVFLDLNISLSDYESIKKVYDNDATAVYFKIEKEDTSKIRMAILGKCRNYKHFASKHKEFDSVYISNVLNGRLKLRSTKYVRFIELLTNKYGLVLDSSNAGNEVE